VPGGGKLVAVKQCAVCRTIPDFLEVETLHGDQRLPSAVGRLLSLGWYIECTSLARCTGCGTFFAVHYDHDSESGVGIGYTDESVRRLSQDEAIACCHAALKRYPMWNTRPFDSALHALGAF
jgi:hypothetical protein